MQYCKREHVKMNSKLNIVIFIILFLSLSNVSGQNINYHNVEYRTRLKKSDPFIDDFVPTEYTSGLLSKYESDVKMNAEVIIYL